MRNVYFVVLVMVIGFASGCTSAHMKVKPEKEVVQPSQEKAKVVFMRDSMVGSAIQASLFDVTSGEPEFIGT